MLEEMMREVVHGVEREVFEEMGLHPGGSGSGSKTRCLDIPLDLYPVGDVGGGKTGSYTFVGFDELIRYEDWEPGIGELLCRLPPRTLEDKRIFKTIL